MEGMFPRFLRISSRCQSSGSKFGGTFGIPPEAIAALRWQKSVLGAKIRRLKYSESGFLLLFSTDSVTVMIDPETGKLIDIVFFNYYYDHNTLGINSIKYTTPYKWDFIRDGQS